MKIFLIIYKEVVQSFRDIKTFLIMLFMPTVLTMILGITFNKTFDKTIDLSNINVRYVLNCSDSDKKVFDEFIKLGQSLNINIEPFSEVYGENFNYVDLKTNNKFNENKESDIILKVNSLDDIHIYYDKYLKSYGKIVTSLIDTFIKRYKAIGLAIPYVNGDVESLTAVPDKSFIKIKSLQGNREPSSLDYYGVVMITMTIMFAAVTGAYKIIKERSSNTLGKLQTLPVSSIEILIGKLFGATLIVMTQIVVVILISKNLLGVYWGNSLNRVFLLLFSEGILAVSIGLSAGYFIKDNKSAWLIILSLIMIFGFLGGAFVPLDIINSESINILASLSPLNYINTSIFKIIYENEYVLANYTSLLSVMLSLTLITGTSLFMEVRR